MRVAILKLRLASNKVYYFSKKNYHSILYILLHTFNLISTLSLDCRYFILCAAVVNLYICSCHLFTCVNVNNKPWKCQKITMALITYVLIHSSTTTSPTKEVHNSIHTDGTYNQLLLAYVGL